MKKTLIVLGLIFSLQSFADTSIVCNDQNSHSVYELQLSSDLQIVKLVTHLGDSSVLSSGANKLNFQEGESSPTVATYGGASNIGLSIVLLFNRSKAVALSQYEILEVSVYYQKFEDDILSGKTEFLCSKN